MRLSGRSRADNPIQLGRCWLFRFNTAAAIETGDFRDGLAVGPLVVPKDGDQPWIAPSSTRAEIAQRLRPW
ncbi:hypothetical protein Acsp02_96030 [Actinoplanes sp. NBRC 103695]|nr:hypothetical protein Acsp02_96030 [Actinoplanes sp. NBRC 103695]